MPGRTPVDFVTEFLNQYGYPILFLLGLVEFLGVPVATSPVLLLVGASAATQTFASWDLRSACSEAVRAC